jgi:nicotinamide-nucleotide amidase
MTCWILAIGSEMLTPLRVDTNSLEITARLNEIGCDVRFKAVIGDSVEELTALLARGIGQVDVIVCTGGLGPTEDDVTREAVARALQLPLEFHQAILDRIEERFAKRGVPMPGINRRQAMVPHGATVLENRNGTAPGLWFEHEGTCLAVLPGPPREMRPMLEVIVREWLKPRMGSAGLFRRVLKITGLPESEVDARAEPVYGRWTTQPVPIATTILASLGQIELHLTAHAKSREAGDAALDEAVAQLRPVLGEALYTDRGDPLERVVGDLLRTRQLTIAVAESCTGGLLASRLTDVPGSSDYFERGAVCYSNRAKIDWLGVPEQLIASHGAVSEPVASAMAEGIRARSGAQVSAGITGIAGPGGGTAEKPVGTVAIAAITPGGARVETFRFLGPRDMVKFQASQAALNMIRLLLGGVDSARAGH